MNHTVSHSDRLFVDRSLVSQSDDQGHVSSLRLFCQDQTDYTEAAVRFFLMLCIPVSLWLCGMKVSATSAVRQPTQIQAPSWSAACLTPSLPKVQIDALIR